MMNRTQASKFADKIVAQARKAGSLEPDEWEVVAFPVSLLGKDAMQRLDENYAIINGCLPMGWRITGNQGDSMVVVRRRL